MTPVRAAAALFLLASRLAAQSDVKDLPLVEVPAQSPSRTFAVFVSGDGGWAAMDREVAKALAARGVSVAGLNSLKYFWRTRSPDAVGADLARIVRHYMGAWQADSVVVIGYSRGAGIVPFMVNRVGDELRLRVRMVVLLGAEHTAGFTFHVTDLFTSGPKKGEPPVLPEIEQLGATPVLCFYGADEDDTVCPELKPPAVSVRLPGGHHFDKNYAALGARIAEALQGRTGIRP
ncbi:MAG: virulence factor family protein [Gemmatimonadales bacterium]